MELCDKKIEECRARFESENIGEETRIIVENILAQEKYNNIYADFPKSKELKPLITDRYSKTKDFLDKNKELSSDISKYFYVVAGDVLSSSLQFLPLSKAMNEGLQIKVYYEKALELDPNFSYCLANYGQWLYHAPGFAGGSKKTALECFHKASENAKTPFEIYYANFLVSQTEFENKNYEEASAALEKSLSAREGNVYMTFIKRINDLGYSIFYYIPNREKVDKMLAE
ncbi:MAG: hypothetical protein K6G52_07940 [Treponemataceae bacterium]|nr:hypothetical protein [Treponemataceae bacterium]